MRSSSILPLLALAGCINASKGPAAPAPESLTVSATPARVLAVARAAFVAARWDVTLSDNDGGVVRAEHVAAREGNATWISCPGKIGTPDGPHSANAGFTSTIAVEVFAQLTAGGTSVQISGSVTKAQTDGMLGDRIDVACVSSGAMEQALADSIQAAAD